MSTPARSNDDFRLGMIGLTLIAQQLLYASTYVELARWRLFGGAPPSIVFDLYLWVLLVSGSMIAGAVASARGESRDEDPRT